MLRASAVLVSVFVGSMVGAQEPVRYQDWLRDLTDLDRLWRPPPAGERCIQFSSYDRKSEKGPGDPEAWYANDDCGKFLRVETRDEKNENVMVDVEGAGAIVRIWSANPKGTLFFYVDGAAEPTWSVAAQELLGGKKAPFVEPISGVRARGWNSHLPVPFAKRIKVTCDEGGFYYHVNVRLLAGRGVEPFRPEMLEQHIAEITAMAARLGASERSTDAIRSRSAQGKLAAETVLHRVEGPGVVTTFFLKLDPGRAGAEGIDLMRTTLLVIACDGVETVRVPVGDFFGSAPDGKPYLGYAMALGEVGGTCRLPMPFHESFEAKLVADEPANASYSFLCEVRPGDLQKDALAFHAAWHQRKNVKIHPRSDQLVLDAEGPGRFVGCTLVVRNPVRAWWGEGDEKFFVDGEAFPSTFGTGTEDFFGYAWCSPALFASAYHAQPQCDGPANRGYTCVNRFLIPEAVPFQKRFRFDLEVWHWKECEVDYATTAYWYAPARAKSGLPEVPPAAERKKVPLPPTVIWKAPDAIEAESLPVLSLTRGKHQVQDMQQWEGQWSDGKQLWWTGAMPGDRLTLGLPVAKAGKYRVKLQLTKASDYGFVQVLMNDAELGTFQDLFSENVVPSGLIDLGEVELPAGEAKLGLEIVGRNAKARPSYMVGVDHLVLEPVAK